MQWIFWNFRTVLCLGVWQALQFNDSELVIDLSLKICYDCKPKKSREIIPALSSNTISVNYSLHLRRSNL